LPRKDDIMQICYCTYKNNLRQIELRNLARKEFKRIETKEIQKIVVGATIIMLGSLNTLQAKMNVLNFTKRVDTKGYEILSLIQIVGYWAAIIYAGIDMVKSFKKQDIAGLIAIAIKYAFGVGFLYGLPNIFDMIKDIFKE
jgi:hypothetical protein